MTKTAPALALLLATFAAGCGGKAAAPTTSPTANHTTTSVDPRAAFERSVRATLRANDRLSGYVLWHNTIPAWATNSTRGPALEALRTSAAQRRARGIHVRTLSDHLQIASLTIDPSYTRASGIVRSRQRLRPYNASRALGRAVDLDEKGRFELRRVKGPSHFVVWRVVSLK